MRRRHTGPAVALFPFLAVLLCAMGALILLLLVMTRQIREDALRIAQVDPAPAPALVPVEKPQTIPTVVVTITPPVPPTPIDPNVALRERLAVVTADRTAAAAETERLRRELATRKDMAEAAESKLASAVFDVEAARRRFAAREAELRERETERARLADAVTRAEGTLASAREAAETAEPKFTILPYDGRYGTARRPILIECTGDAIRFLPEDVALTAEDIRGFPPGYNPLLAGAVALRTYWSRTDGPSSPKPYVLLLVREDGVAAYYVARSLLQSLGDETGYELITENIDLALPDVDPDAREICREAVEDALRQRPSLLATTQGRDTDRPRFATGRFDIDPSDHDPTRPPESPLGSVFGSRPPVGGRSDSFPPERRLAGTEESPALRPVPPPTSRELDPLSPGSSPAGSIAQRLTRQNREQRDREFTESSNDLLEQALAEGLPSFGSPGGKRRWGVSAPTASIALERPVAVEVTADRIVVGTQLPIEVGEEGVTAATLEAVLAAVDREANAWGRSPGQFYWSPRLRATVRPDGTRHFDRLGAALGRAGLRATDRIVLEPTAPAFVELSHAAAAP